MKGVARFEELKEGQTYPAPTLRLSEFYAKELLSGLSREMDAMGIKPDSQTKLEGILVATKYHLEDMRKLVFPKEGDGR